MESYALPARRCTSLPRRPHERSVEDLDPSIQLAMKRFGRWIQQRRVAAGISQAQLERMSGLDQTAISRLENGRLRGLRLHRLAAVLAALDGLDIADPTRDRNPPTRF
jgi:ribosome-binding protein aMBF1 (putative translation factor)